MEPNANEKAANHEMENDCAQAEPAQEQVTHLPASEPVAPAATEPEKAPQKGAHKVWLVILAVCCVTGLVLSILLRIVFLIHLIDPARAPQDEAAEIAQAQTAQDEAAGIAQDNALYVQPELYVDEQGLRWYDLTVLAEKGSTITVQSTADLITDTATVPHDYGATLRVQEDTFFPNTPLAHEQYVMTPTLLVTRSDGRAYDVYISPITMTFPHAKLSLTTPDVAENGVFSTGDTSIPIEGITDDHTMVVKVNFNPITVYEGGIFQCTLHLPEYEGFSADKPFSCPVEIIAEQNNYVTTKRTFTVQYEPPPGVTPTPAPASPTNASSSENTAPGATPTPAPTSTPTPTPAPDGKGANWELSGGVLTLINDRGIDHFSKVSGQYALPKSIVFAEGVRTVDLRAVGDLLPIRQDVFLNPLRSRVRPAESSMETAIAVRCSQTSCSSRLATNAIACGTGCSSTMCIKWWFARSSA